MQRCRLLLGSGAVRNVGRSRTASSMPVIRSFANSPQNSGKQHNAAHTKDIKERAEKISRQADVNAGKVRLENVQKLKNQKQDKVWFSGEYEGDLQDGKRHGQGTYTNRKSTYTGAWRDNKRHGHGEATFQSGNVYIGEWENDLPHGQGKLKYVDGSELEGVFQKGHIHRGKGRYIPNYMDVANNLYEGTWVDGKLQGSGLWICSDGTTYVGEWKDSQRHGYGTRKTQAATYEGEWQFDRKEGQGKITFETGHVYEGHWEKNVYHGPGKVIYADGATLEGTFHQGKIQEGKGRWVPDLKAVAPRTVCEGTWVGGKMQGHGSIVGKDGYSYVGDLMDGKRHGHGVVTYPDGRTLRGEFADGEILHGEGWQQVREAAEGVEGVEGSKERTFRHGRWVEGVFTATPPPEAA